MSIEIPDWVAQLAVDEMTRVPPESDNQWFSRDIKEVMHEVLRAALEGWLVQEPYRLGNRYMTQGGEEVTLNQVANYGTSYESMCDDAGVHRYTRRDFGRVTGSAHDYSDQRNIPPLYTLRQEKPE